MFVVSIMTLHCFVQVVRMSRNGDIVTSLDLHSLMSRLDLSKDVSNTVMPAYEELDPDSRVGDGQTQEMYRAAVHKIINWPRDDDNMVGN